MKTFKLFFIYIKNQYIIIVSHNPFKLKKNYLYHFIFVYIIQKIILKYNVNVKLKFNIFIDKNRELSI